jgi:hypothetical protein
VKVLDYDAYNNYKTTSSNTSQDRWKWAGEMPVPAATDLEDLSGYWDIRASKLHGDGYHASCGDVGTSGEIEVYVEEVARRGPAAPQSRPTGPEGAEENDDCSASQSASTTFRFVRFPSEKRPVLLPVDGERRFAGAHATSIEVTDWNDADRLALDIGGSPVVLTPASSSATLTGGNWWVGGIDFEADRTADSDPWSYPEVEITHACPSTPAGSVRNVATGYGLTLGALSSFADDATGLPGLGNLLVGAEESTWDVYGVRVETFSPPSPATDVHRLRIELRGTEAGISIPLKLEATDEWSFDLDHPFFAAVGTVERAEDGLTLSLTNGTIYFDAGDVNIGAASAELPLLATD